jgi:hypothetical protein
MSDEVFEVCGETMFSGSYSALVTTERPPSALELGSNPGVGNAQIEFATTKVILRTNELSTQC